MSEDIKKILELTTNEVGEIIIDYIDKNGITKEWKYSSDKEILNYITNLQQKYDTAIFVGKELNKSLEDYKSRNERLNNIINELEKYIKTDAKIELYKDVSGFRTFVDGQDLLNKLQELKGSDNNDYNEK